jgi:DNA-3-methyladenine glycosylase
MRLPQDFFNNHVADVARELIGKKLYFAGQEGIITETEAYRGFDDEASHAYRGITQRTAVMFGPPGYTYVYMIYGVYHCLNVVTEEVGQASAVLIRGLKLPHIYLDGPGKICRHLGITKVHNGISLIDDNDFFITKGIKIKGISATKRIGISKAVDKPWRFIAHGKEILSI